MVIREPGWIRLDATAGNYIAGLASRSGFDDVYLGIILRSSRNDRHRHMLQIVGGGERADCVLPFSPTGLADRDSFRIEQQFLRSRQTLAEIKLVSVFGRKKL